MNDDTCYPFPPLDSLPEDLRARILEVQQKIGFVPLVFLTLARRPQEFRAFLAYHDALMLKDVGLSKGEREIVVVGTSVANRCPHCVVAHGALLHVHVERPLLADQVATNHRKAANTPRQRAMLDFALKVCSGSAAVEEANFAALFGMSNRIANLSSMQPNSSSSW